MKLIGKLKNQVEHTDNKTEKRRLIEKAGMKLTDEELEKVAGGTNDYKDSEASQHDKIWQVRCEGNYPLPGCGFFENFATQKAANMAIEQYQSRCPNCKGIDYLKVE